MKASEYVYSYCGKVRIRITEDMPWPKAKESLDKHEDRCSECVARKWRAAIGG